MHRRRFMFAFVLAYLLFGTINVVMANIGPNYEINAGTPTGAGPTYTVNVSGILVIPAGSTINQNTLKATSGGSTYTGSQTFTLTTAGPPGGNDKYSVSGSVKVPAGTYTVTGTVIYTPPGSVISYELQSSSVISVP